MPNRIVRDGIITSKRVNALEPRAELFYRRLLNVVDDYGRFHADLDLLRAACYPLQLDNVSRQDIGAWLEACETKKLIKVHRSASREYVLEVLDFNQQIRAKKSKFPLPLEHQPSKLHSRR